VTDEALQALLVETGHKHHEAYRASDGVDPEWAVESSGSSSCAILADSLSTSEPDTHVNTCGTGLPHASLSSRG
jgi:hypothetical protein